MKDSPADLSPPAVKPYFFGAWSNQAIAAQTWVNLTITTVVWKQKGMQLSGGGCKVPLTGLYFIGAKARSDSGAAAGPSYFHLRTQVNGNDIAYSIRNNPNIGGYFFPYSTGATWGHYPLNAGDIVTCLIWSVIGGNYYSHATWAGDGLCVLYDSPLAP